MATGSSKKESVITNSCSQRPGIPELNKWL